MSSQPETRSLHTKLAEVMAEAERVPKNGTAPASMGSFRFATIGDIEDAVRKALGSRKVSFLPVAVEPTADWTATLQSGKTMFYQSVRVTYRFTDGETGESVEIQSMGTGSDTQDKATPKALTGALKYALLEAFLIPTGDDQEAHDASNGEAVTAAQRQHAPQRHVAAAPRRSSTAVPEPEWDGLPVAHPNGTGHGTGPMTTRELLNLAEAHDIDTTRVGQQARQMFGKSMLRELTDEQRRAVAEELELVPVTT
jgi:hypothetical protein